MGRSWIRLKISDLILDMSYNVDEEISVLVSHMERLGSPGAENTLQVKFKILFDDDDVGNSLESLCGTLKAAKKRKIISYGPELLLQGASDNEIITLLKR